MKHFIFFLDFDADYLTKREPLRAAHLAHLRKGVADGLVVLGGASIDADPMMGVIVCKAETKDEVERFAAADPYVTGGVASRFRVREWTTVVGEGALTKV
jgi:uncharacterized protein YciI